MQEKKKSTKSIILLVLAALLIAAAGCTTFKDRIRVEIMPEDELYNLGIAKFNEEKWDEAIAVFERFERLYVNSSRVQEIRLKRADAYFNKGRSSSYILAKAEYQSFVQLYPRYDDADYIWKQIAVCSFKQILPPNRDQSQTEEAIKDFQTFLQKYPDSEYVPEVRQNLNDAFKVLAEHHQVVGMHYFSRGLYAAAAERLKKAIQQNVPLDDSEALFYHLVLSLARASDIFGKMHDFMKRVEQEEESERNKELHERYLYEAKQYLDELKQRFPEATNHHSELEREINSVTPITEQKSP